MLTTVAVVNEPGGEFVLEEMELDAPRSDEVLVRIVASGLCHTDISMRELLPAAMFPKVMGHEGVGVVEQVGADVHGIEVGDHVVMSLRSCRACVQCLNGLAAYCESGIALNYTGVRLDGSTTHHRDGAPVFGSFHGQSSFARHAIAYRDNVVVVDPSLDLVSLAPYGCAYQTGAGAVLNALDPGPADSLVVYGVGAVGLSALVAARAQGVETIVAVDLMQDRLDVAAGYGAIVVNPADLQDREPGEAQVGGMVAPDTPLVARIKELTGGGSSTAVDTTGAPAVIKQAVKALGVHGRLMALGVGAPEFAVDAYDLCAGGKTVRSSLEGDADPHVMVPRLIEMNRTGRFDVDRLAATYAFSEIMSAVADVTAGKVVKPILVW